MGCPMTCNEKCEPTPHPTYSQVPVAAPTVGPTCFDDDNWYYKKTKYDCDYVAKKTTRCQDDNEWNGVSAFDACKETCGRCLPTEAPTEGSTCVDSDSWYYKKTKRVNRVTETLFERHSSTRVEAQPVGSPFAFDAETRRPSRYDCDYVAQKTSRCYDDNESEAASGMQF